MKSLKCKECDVVIFFDEQSKMFEEIHKRKPSKEELLTFCKEKLMKHYMEWHIPYGLLSRQEQNRMMMRWMKFLSIDRYGNIGVK